MALVLSSEVFESREAFPKFHFGTGQDGCLWVKGRGRCHVFRMGRNLMGRAVVGALAKYSWTTKRGR